MDKVSAKGNSQSKMGKVTITIDIRILEIVLVPHQKGLHYCNVSTPSAKTCSFSEGDSAEEISSAPVVSMALPENMY